MLLGRHRRFGPTRELDESVAEEETYWLTGASPFGTPKSWPSSASSWVRTPSQAEEGRCQVRAGGSDRRTTRIQRRVDAFECNLFLHWPGIKLVARTENSASIRNETRGARAAGLGFRGLESQRTTSGLETSSSSGPVNSGAISNRPWIEEEGRLFPHGNPQFDKGNNGPQIVQREPSRLIVARFVGWVEGSGST